MEKSYPGGHYAAIVAAVNQESSPQNQPIVAPSVSSLLLLKKEGGEKYGNEVQGVEDALPTFVFSYPQLFNLGFKNTGNVHLILYGNAQIKDLFGRVIYNGVLNTSSLIIFPQNSRALPIQLNPVEASFPISINTLVVKGDDSLHKTSYLYQKKFVYVNILVTASTLFLVMICVILLRKIKKKR